MPMIDVYAAAGTFVDKNKLAAGSGECSDEVGGRPVHRSLQEEQPLLSFMNCRAKRFRMQPAITTTCAFRFLLQSMC